MFGERSAEGLGPHLAHLSSLQHLDLSVSTIGAGGVRTLGPYLAQLSSLKHLDLSNIQYYFQCHK